MYDRRFFASKLGLAALVSLAAMVAFNALVLSQQLASAPPAEFAGAAWVELA